MSRALKQKTRGRGKRASAEIRKGGGRDGNGVQKYDGAENRASGSKPEMVSFFAGSGKVIRTH